MCDPDVPLITRQKGENRFARQRSHTNLQKDFSRIFRFTFAISVDPRKLTQPLASTVKKNAKDARRKSEAFSTNPVYFRLEYTLDTENSLSFATDVAVFSSNVAKVYPTGCNPQVASLRNDGKVLWIVWKEQVFVNCTNDRIEDLWRLCEGGGILIKCWDKREKCAIQTRFDRPRSLIQNQTPCDSQDVLNITISEIIERIRSHAKDQDVCRTNDDMSIPNTSLSKEMQSATNRDVDQLQAAPKQISHSTSLLDHNPAWFSRQPPQINKRFSIINSSNNDSDHNTFTGTLTTPGTTGTTGDQTVERWGCVCLVLNTGHLFRFSPPVMISTAAPREFVAGLTTKLSTESLPRYSVRYSDTVEFEELLVGLELDGPLLTEDQRELFKPLVIHVGGIAGLPLGFFSSWDQMNQTCKPLTLQWQLADLKSYHSRCYRQNDSIDMDEVQVILMGLLPVEKIRELLQSRPLIIDLYDRVPDSKSTAESPKDAFSVGGTYGTQPGDDKFGYVEANMENIHESDEPSTAENKFTVDQYPTGRVVVHLREMLVLEQNVMDCTYSVTPLSETTLDLQTAMRTTSENPRKVKRQYVGYLDAGCSMSVRIELSGNLNQLKTQEESPSLGLKRFVFVVRMCDTDPGIQQQSTQFLEDLHKFLVDATGDSLQLPLDHGVAECSGVLVTERCENQSNTNDVSISRQSGSSNAKPSDNDLLTGFHLNDREFDFIILEAPDSQLARKLEGLIEEHMKHGKDVFGQYIRILYNSELSFTEHLYWHLDWALSPIQLMVPMNELIRQPLFHVRDLVPRLAYCAIERLQTIRNTCQTLVDVAQADLFPTMAMLEAIRGEFAIPTALVSNACSRGSTASRRVPIKQSTDSAPTDRVEVTLPAAHKETTLKRPWTNYIGRQPIFSRNRTCFSSITRLFRSTTEMSNATFSYSIQKLNATELAKSELQTTLLSPRKRYTYSQFYLRSGEFAAAVDPLDWPSTLRRVGSDTRNRNLRSQERKPKWDAYPPKVGHAQERVHFKARIQKKLNQGLLPTPDLRI